MASIANVRFSATKATGAGNNWVLTVNYQARFSDKEANDGFTFRDGFVVMEEDPNDPDETLTSVVGGSTFNPRDRVVERTLTHRISGDILNTEKKTDGKEELFVVVHLRNLDFGLLAPTRRSPILKLDP